MNVVGDMRSRRPFVHVPTCVASASTKPAAATIAIAIQKRPVVCVPTWAAPHSPNPATPAASASVRPRVTSYIP